jgi:UDP-glucose 4-epimerase/UDP-glucuronate decarboxylase
VPERALVTGGAGFLGLRLARALVERGDDVTLLDDFSRGRDDPPLRELLGDARLVEHDLTRPLPAQRLGGGYGAVYHLAAIVGTQASAVRPHEVLRVGLAATLNLLDWAAGAQPERLFLSSTSEVTDGAVRAELASVPVPDNAPLVVPDVALPRASYAISKIAAEAQFLHYGNQHGALVRIGRFFNVYGPRMGYDHVIPQLICRTLDGEDPFPVHGAWQTRSFCFVDDAVEAALLLADLATAEPVVASVGNDMEEIVIADLVERILALAGHGAELEIHHPPSGSPDRRCPDLCRLRELTGYEPRVGLDDGLRQTFEWYRRHHEDEPQAAGAGGR